MRSRKGPQNLLIVALHLCAFAVSLPTKPSYKSDSARKISNKGAK